MLISVICFGNIMRSRVLHKYIQYYLETTVFKCDIFSCGIADRDVFNNEKELLDEVRHILQKRGLDVDVNRNIWDNTSKNFVKNSDIVLVADEHVRHKVLSDVEIDESKVYLFYEFINEGKKNFNDTFDYNTRKQNDNVFINSFDELRRIAYLAACKIIKS